MNVPFAVYLPYLLLTLVIEVPLVAGLLARRCGLWRSVLAGFLASSLTHPLLWFVWSRVISPRTDYTAYVASGETLVVLIEAGVLFLIALLPAAASSSAERYGRTRLAGVACAVSLVANSASWGTGVLLHHFRLLRPIVMTAAQGIETILNWLR